MKRSSTAQIFLAALISILAISQVALAASSLQSQDPKLKSGTTKESCANADKSPRDSVAKINPPSSGGQATRTKDGQIVQ